MKERTTIQIYRKDRIWLTRLKDRYNLKGLSETVEKLRSLIQKHKMEGELK